MASGSVAILRRMARRSVASAVRTVEAHATSVRRLNGDRSYVRHRWIYGSQGGWAHPHRGPEASGVSRLRLGRHRARRRRGRLVPREAGREARQSPDGHRRPHPPRRDRSRPYPVGDPWPPERPERPPPPGLHRRDHGHPQRDHRELPGAARRARGARPHADVRDRYRGDRPPDRGGVHGRSRRRGPRRPSPDRGGLRDRRDASRRGRTGSSVPARTCRSSWVLPTARASSPRMWRRSWPTRTGSSSSRRATSPISDRGA